MTTILNAISSASSMVGNACNAGIAKISDALHSDFSTRSLFRLEAIAHTAVSIIGGGLHKQLSWDNLTKSLAISWLGNQTIRPISEFLVNIWAERIIDGSKGKPKKALIIENSEDKENKAHPFISDLYNLAKTHSIERIKVDKRQRDLSCLPSDRYDVVWIRCHGWQYEIHPGKNLTVSTSSWKFLWQLGSRVKCAGKVILEACNTASGTNHIAQAIANACPFATVYGSPETVSGKFSLLMNEQGEPHLHEHKFLNFIRGKEVTQRIRNLNPIRFFFARICQFFARFF